MKQHLRRLGLALAAGPLLAGALGCARTASVEHGLIEISEGKSPTSRQVESPSSSLAQATPSGGTVVAFPNDKGGELLRQLLQPPKQLMDGTESGPVAKTLAAPEEVARPTVASSVSSVEPPRAPVDPKAISARPRMLAEDAPLSSYQGDVKGPSELVLATGAPIRLTITDVNQVPPVAGLATPVPDRAPLEDPSADDSLRVALAAGGVLRVNPAPFLRLALPDPYEFVQTVRLKVSPAEGSDPAGDAPRPPRP